MEEQDQPSVSVKDLLARMGKEEAEVVLGGRSRRRRPSANSVSVGDLTGEIPVVRDGNPRTHRAEQPGGRKWSGWSKREDPDAHLDERDREWDFRVLSGEIERVQDHDESADAPAEELEGGPSIYSEQPPFADPHARERAEEERWGHPEEAAPEESSAFEAPADQGEATDRPEPEAAFDSAPGHVGWDEPASSEQTAPAAQEESEQQSWFAEPEAPVTPQAAWPQEAEHEADWHAESGAAAHDEHGAAQPDEHDAKPHKRVSAFKADQLERAREVLAKRKSQGYPRQGFAGALDKLVAIKLPAWVSITLQFVVGFLVGAVLFWVFRQLWRSDYTVFAAVLALITIVVLVLGARWVRRRNDWASMAVAGLVGIWVCFGPLAISLLAR